MYGGATCEAVIIAVSKLKETLQQNLGTICFVATASL